MDEVALRPALPLSWELEPEGSARLLDPRRGTWVRLQPWTVAVLEAIEAKDDLPALLARVALRPDAPREERVRRFVLDLEKAGYVRVELPLPERLGPYRVLEELGRGGIGVAYLCEDTEGARLVVKRAWSYLFPLWATSALVEWEARVLAELDHPRVVRARGAFREGPVAHLARDHVEGEPLSRRDERPAPPDAALRLAREAAEVVAHLHERGWLLVDASPSNFFETPRGLVLGDAGNCLGAKGERPEGLRPGGSRGFVAPEVAAGAPHDARADVWTIGRLLAFVASGRLHRGDPTLARLLEGVPEEVAPAVRALCADDAAARPAGAREAARLLTAP